jgi:hypothetical protein
MENLTCPQPQFWAFTPQSPIADGFFAESGNQSLNYWAAMLSLIRDLAVTVAP